MIDFACPIRTFVVLFTKGGEAPKHRKQKEEKMFRAFILAFLMVAMLSFVCLAEDLSKITDRFYAGLADIIESNMDDPDGCVREVEAYYQNNQALIAQIREATEKAMTQVAPMMAKKMEQYGSMSEEKLEAMERKYGGRQEAMIEKKMSAAGKRYSKAVEDFSMKYPQQGMKIAFKAFELMPRSQGAGQFQVPEEQMQW